MTFRLVPPTAITILRDTRQRTVIDTSDLEESISRWGILSPLIVTDDLVLIAGERRLTTALKLNLAEVPIRLLSDLSEVEQQLIELTENVKRKDLTWQDATRAYEKIHNLFKSQDPTWTMQKTADSVGYSIQILSRHLTVAAELHNPKISSLDTLATAFNMITRANDRKAADAIADIAQSTKEAFDDEEPLEDFVDDNQTLPVPSDPDNPMPAQVSNNPRTASHVTRVTPIPPLSLDETVQRDIIHQDFALWVEDYSGPSFNFIHCDFPYGANMFGGKWGGKGTANTYSDTKDDYLTLISLLCNNLDKLLGHSGHLMFWFSMDYYTETLQLFNDLAPSLVFQRKPLIWAKTDNTGIVSDPKRSPRHVYETALIASREDRPIVKVAADYYGAPTDKRYHPSTKPETVLRHFFTLFVDETTTMLDPTCGGGSALRAAESLGAEKVVGVECDVESVKNARTALRQFRMLKLAAEK